MSKQEDREEIKIFTYDYVVELQRMVEIEEEFGGYLNEVFSYQEKYPKGRTGVYIPKGFDLKMPKKGDSFDLDNSVSLYENISGLNPAAASDVRLWTYLVHTRFWDYMRKRWPIDNFDNPKGRILDRYHLKYLNLQSLTRNGLSRLWWYVHLTIDNKRIDKYELTKILLSRADIAVGLLERSIGSNKNIRFAVLEFLKENEDISKNEKKTRSLLNQVNLLGGVKNLPFLKLNDIKEYLYKIKDFTIA